MVVHVVSVKLVGSSDARQRQQQEQFQAVLQAAANGDWKTLESLDPETVRTARCATGCTSLHWAAGARQQQPGAVRVCAYLVEECQMSPNIRCTGRARGRTPLHYAARNGCLATAQYLVRGTASSAAAAAHPQQPRADPHAKAKHGVTPFQLAVFQNQLELCRWLVDTCGVVAAAERNDFDCGAVHWLGIGSCAKNNSNDWIPMAEWLRQQGCDFRATQKQGHSALHKAAWKGHLPLVEWMHDTLDMWDDAPDRAGNFAADLARMGQHGAVVEYLQQHCSRERAASCAILEIPLTEAADPVKVRQAYLALAKRLHPDRQQQVLNHRQDSCFEPHKDPHMAHYSTDNFDALQRAYHHLTMEAGRGKQCNPAHSLKLLLENYLPVARHQDHDNKHGDNHVQREDSPATVTAEGIMDTCNDSKYHLNARMIAVLLEFGENGVNLCNLPKKWLQVWGPDVPFPFGKGSSDAMGLTEALRRHCSDVLDLRRDECTGAYRAYIKKQTLRS